MNNSNLPPEFIKRISRQLGDESEDFIKSHQQPAPVSIRVHPRKFPHSHFWHQMPQIPWCEQGYYLSERPIFTLDPLFHAGAYYVQEASSMFLFHVLEQILPEKKVNLKVLDLCASPGGKSTLLSALLNGEGLLISNEVIRSRILALKENTIRWGYDNVIITNNDPEDFVNSEMYFDVVVVDAPCSGEGLFRKDPESIDEWSVENTHHCSLRQKRILNSATEIVAEEGFLIYSTCTYNPEENDAHQQQIKASGFEPVTINLKNEWNITKPSPNSVQFFPHKNRGEGFYLAIYKKTGDIHSKIKSHKKNKPEFCNTALFNPFITLPESRTLIRTEKLPFFLFPHEWIEWLGIVSNNLRIVQAGIEVGEIKGKDVIPSHALAMSFFLNKQITTFEVDEYQAKVFLSKDNITLPENTPKGFVLLTYQGISLGWVKNVGARANNYYPQEFRIRMRWN